MIEYIRNNQLDIMLFFSGACAVLIPLTWVTTTLSCKRKWMLTLIELSSALLLIFDRFAYIYRGDPSNLGYWMVRISNFFVFSMQVFELEALNIYLSDLFRCEGKLICNDLCQALNWAKAKTNFIQFPGSIRMGLRYQIPALATLIYVDSGFLPTYRSMVRRERHRLKAWITVACANIVFSWIARTLKRP